MNVNRPKSMGRGEFSLSTRLVNYTESANGPIIVRANAFSKDSSISFIILLS